MVSDIQTSRELILHLNEYMVCSLQYNITHHSPLCLSFASPFTPDLISIYTLNFPLCSTYLDHISPRYLFLLPSHLTFDLSPIAYKYPLLHLHSPKITPSHKVTRIQALKIKKKLAKHAEKLSPHKSLHKTLLHPH